MDHSCKNCGKSFTGTYCSNCGQKFDVPRFTFKHIVEEGFHAFTHADKSFISFIKQLFISPGTLAYNYIVEGKRKQYFNPFTFFLLITAINAFVEGSDLNLKEKLFHYNNEYGHIFNIYSKILFLVTIPVVALTIWLIHNKKPRFFYSEYTVFAMILISLFSIVETVVRAVNYSLTALLHSSISLEDNLIYLMLGIIYIAYADYQFHVTKHTSSFLKSFLTGLLFFAVLNAIQVFYIYAFVNDFQGIGHFFMYGVKIR